MRHRDVGTWLTLLLLPVALAAFRRGVLLALMALLALPPADAWALDWDALWARPDQRAARDLARGSYDTVEAYGDTRWLGAARYRAGDFAGAAEAFAGSDDADGRYNLGNALARSGALDRAIAAYDAALERDPDHADARYNRDLVKHLMDQGHGGSGSPPNDDDGQTGADKPSDDGEGGQDNQPGDSGRATTTGDDTQRYSDSAQPGAGASADATADGSGAGDDGMPEREAAARQPAVDGSSKREADGEKDSVHGARDTTLPDVAGSPEMRQALEQWLRQVPDDPEGLLRRKFLYQYRMREGAG